MLGLGNSIITEGPVEKLLGTYTSDFTGGGGDNSSSWVAYSVQNSASDLTLQTNRTIDGSSGWLKGTYGVQQTNSSGIRIANTGVIYPVSTRIELSYKIYVVDDSDKWGSTDNITTKTYFPGINQTTGPTLDETNTINTNSGVDYFSQAAPGWNAPSTNTISTAGSYVYIAWVIVGDLPQAGAVFYIKDIVINYYSL